MPLPLLFCAFGDGRGTAPPLRIIKSPTEHGGGLALLTENAQQEACSDGGADNACNVGT